MSGKGFETGSKDEFDELLSRVEDLESQVVKLQNIKQPTMPIYPSFAAPNPGDLPDDPVEGQYAVGKDDNIHRWYSNGQWHEASGGVLPWVLLQGNLSGTSFPSGTDVDIPLTGNLVSPLNGGGTNDPTVYKGINFSNAEVSISGPNEPYKYIKLMEPGLYWVESASGWYLDWGTVQVNEHHQHTDGFDSVVQFRAFGISSSSAYIGVGGAPHTQWGIYYHQLLAVDSRATEVYVGTRVKNSSGSTRTVDSGANNMGGGIFIVQLNKVGVSNPDGN